MPDSENAVSLSPSESTFLHVRGWIHAHKGELGLALADLNRAIEIKQDTAFMYADRGYAHELSGERDAALADYKKALSLKTVGHYDERAKAEALQHMTALAAATPNPGPGDRKVAPQPQPVQVPVSAPDKRIVLVIGNAAYTNVRALKNADADARAVAASFRKLGFSEVIEKHDLTLTQLMSELKSFGDRASDYDWAVVYYAGHGIEIGGINYLIPVDAELSVATHVDDEAFPLDRVLAKVEGAHKLRLVILDACRENPFIAKMASCGRQPLRRPRARAHRAGRRRDGGLFGQERPSGPGRRWR